MLSEERAGALYRLIQDKPAALAEFKLRLEIPGPDPPIKFWVDAAELAAELGDPVLLEKSLAEIRKTEPAHPILRHLASSQTQRG
jgi:hypothetical protein